MSHDPVIISMLMGAGCIVFVCVFALVMHSKRMRWKDERLAMQLRSLAEIDKLERKARGE